MPYALPDDLVDFVLQASGRGVPMPRRTPAGVVPSVSAVPVGPMVRTGPAAVTDAAPPRLTAKLPPQSVTPEDLSSFDAATAADREASAKAVFAQNLSRAAALYRGSPVGPMAQAVPTNVRDWVLKRQLAAEGAAADAANASAPEEWGAPPGLKRTEAVQWLLRQKSQAGDPLLEEKRAKLQAEVEKLRNPDKHGPPTKEQIARGEVLGIHPAEDEDSIHFEAAIRSAENAKRSADARGVGREVKTKASTYLGPDFEFGPEVPPMSVPDTTRAKLMDEAGLVNHITDSAQRLRDLLKEHGPNIMGKAATEMSTLVEDLKLTVKDPVYNLGVLNGRDYELISRVISDPTSAKQILSSKAGIRDLDTALRTAQSQWRNKIRARMRGYGAHPTKGSRYAADGGGGQAGGEDAPPVPGAIRTKSGKWAVKNAQGQYEYVEGE